MAPRRRLAPLDGASVVARGRAVMQAEARAVNALGRALDGSFAAAVELIVRGRGRLVVSGMGKAGFIAQKISATFASTGTPSLFLHPADALHGDLGRIAAGDVLMALSHSGETAEVVRLIGPAKRVGARVLAVTAEAGCTLSRLADLTLVMGRQIEAGNGLAPTTSTTVMMALGDALAVAVLEHRGFSVEQFHQFHPAGALGRQLMRVREVMRQGDMLPRVGAKATVRDALRIMTTTPGRPGAAMMLDGRGRLLGLFTDGDLRRHVERGLDGLDTPLSAVMCADPRTVSADQTLGEAAAVLSEHHVDQVPVVDAKGRAVGLLDVQDLLALRFG
jgi:arabinose-5-phosphate isomerase